MGIEIQEITKLNDCRPLFPDSLSVFTHTLVERLGVTLDDLEPCQDGGTKSQWEAACEDRYLPI